jgi:hypothetical protein
MRRRVVCPRSHPASLCSRTFSPLRYGSRYFPGGHPPGPPVALCSRLRPHWPPTPGPAAPSDGLVLGSLRPRVGGVVGWSCRPLYRLRWLSGGLQHGARRARRRASSLAVAALAPHLRFGCGSDAASSLRNRWSRRISDSHLAVAADLGSVPPCDGRPPVMPVRGAVPVAGATGAPHPRPVRPLFTSRTLVTLRLRHAAISGAGVTVRGRESHPGTLACPLFPAGMRALGAIHNRRTYHSGHFRAQTHTSELFGIAELKLNEILTRHGYLLFLSDY